MCYPNELIPLPPNVDLEQAAMLSINPATAYSLLLNLKEGEWLIQNAANSAVGKLVIQFAAAKGVKTVNIVRRENVVGELKELGANVVIVGENDLASKVAIETEGAPIFYALDAIGGKSSGALVDCLTPGIT